MAVADPEEGSWGAGPPLFLDQTEARRAEKNFFGESPPLPPSLPKGLDDFPHFLSQGLDPALFCFSFLR